MAFKKVGKAGGNPFAPIYRLEHPKGLAKKMREKAEGFGKHEAKEKALKKAKGFKPPYPYEKSSEGKVYRHPKE